MTGTASCKTPELVDFHCHLDLYDDHEALIAECERARVAALAVTTTPKAWQRNCQLTAGCRYVRVALGLHPQLASERGDELPLFERLLSGTRYVGEVGLDAGPRFYRSIQEQERVFERILLCCAEQGEKILTVHSVRAVKRVLDQIEKNLPPDRGRVILHWFTGTLAEARRAVDLGCYFSVNIEMTRIPKHLATIASLPLNTILTESDGPFISLNERSIRPCDVRLISNKLGTALGLSEEEMRKIIISNFSRLVSF